MSKHFQVFECEIRENNEIVKTQKLGKKFYGGRKKLIDNLIKEYPDKNLIIFGVKKGEKEYFDFEIRRKNIKLPATTGENEVPILNGDILIRKDKRVGYVAEKDGSLFINEQEPIEETESTKQILLVYNNDKKEWQKILD